MRHWRAQIDQTRLPTEPSDRVCSWRTVRLVIEEKQYIGQANDRQLHKQGEGRRNKVGGRGNRLGPIGHQVPCVIANALLAVPILEAARPGTLQQCSNGNRRKLKDKER